MTDKKSDIFNKPTAVSTADAAKKEANRVEAAGKPEPTEEKVSAAHIQHNKNHDAAKLRAEDAKRADAAAERRADTGHSYEFNSGKRRYTRTYPAGRIPQSTWGVGIWSMAEGSPEYACFLDSHNEWWWATTTKQNGINPCVEKARGEPVGWRSF